MVTDRAAAFEDRNRMLVDALVEQGSLKDGAWREAFLAVPRHAFVPSFLVPAEGAPGWRVVREGEPGWIDGVYSDQALTTQVGGEDDARQGAPTSSSSAPSLMACMLAHLDVQDGHRVLEIGTGTGYNAALLAHRLGDDRVTSVEVDPHLVALARLRLASLGYHPVLVHGDGRAACCGRAPFDRVLATVAVAPIPPAWIAQTRPGGKVLVALHRTGRGGLLALLTVDEDGVATGPILPTYGGFMATRDRYAANRAADLLRATDPATGTVRPTGLPARSLTDPSAALGSVAALTGALDEVHGIGFTPTGGRPQDWFLHDDGSWACVTQTEDGGDVVTQYGPQLLWDRIEDFHREWTALGSPGRDGFGVTVTPHRQWVWLDSPDSKVTWPLG